MANRMKGPIVPLPAHCSGATWLELSLRCAPAMGGAYESSAQTSTWRGCPGSRLCVGAAHSGPSLAGRTSPLMVTLLHTGGHTHTLRCCPRAQAGLLCQKGDSLGLKALARACPRPQRSEAGRPSQDQGRKCSERSGS